VVLPPDVLEQLRASERGVSEEIRRRIVLTLEAETYDEQTRELAVDIMGLADEVTRQSEVPWHSNPKAHQALATAIQVWLEDHPPTGFGAASAALFGPDHPETLGRSIAKYYERFKAVRKKTEKEIAALWRRGSHD
jgi:hypothetical protein